MAGDELDILFLIPGLDVGGAEQHTLGLRECLDQRGLKTGLLVHAKRRSATMVAHPGARGARAVDSQGMSDIGSWLRLRARLREQPSAIIIAINQTPLIVAVVSRLLGGTRAKIACVFHTTMLRDSETRMFFLFRWALRLADALVFVSANQKAYWTQRGLACRRMPVILNGVDLGRFSPLSASERAAVRMGHQFDDDDLVVGLVATFRAEKNHAALIAALVQLRASGVPAKVLLVGNGPTRPLIEAQVDALNLRDAVVFAGEQADVRPFIGACDVGVLCSTAVETFSLSALEFLSMGVPMVMSNIGGASEIVKHGTNGLLFEAGDDDALARCLETVADPAKRGSLAGAAVASMARLSHEAMVDGYIRLFNELRGAP